MKITILILLGTTIGLLHAHEILPDESRLKNSLAILFTHDHSISRECDRLFSKYGSDSNLFVNVSKQIYEQKKDYLVRSRALETISLYGTRDEIEYLIQCATNHTYWTDAARSALRLEAPSNLVARAQQLIAIDRPDASAQEIARDDADLVYWLVSYAMRRELPLSDRQPIWDFTYSFASNHCLQAGSLDYILKIADSSYEKSRRRKSILQYQHPQLLQTTNSFLKGYVSGELIKLQNLDDSELND